MTDLELAELQILGNAIDNNSRVIMALFAKPGAENEPETRAVARLSFQGQTTLVDVVYIGTDLSPVPCRVFRVEDSGALRLYELRVQQFAEASAEAALAAAPVQGVEQ